MKVKQQKNVEEITKLEGIHYINQRILYILLTIITFKKTYYYNFSTPTKIIPTLRIKL